MKILLINPSLKLLKRDNISITPPLGILYLASYLEEKKHSVQVIDFVIESLQNENVVKNKKYVYFEPHIDFLKNIIEKFDPQLVGISNLMAINEEDTRLISKLIKQINSQIFVVVGGTNASARYKELIKEENIDFIILGEGEQKLTNLVECLENSKNYSEIEGLVYKNREEIFCNDNAADYLDINLIPFPAYNKIDLEIYFHFNKNSSFVGGNRNITIITSRGCPKKCYFCSGSTYLGKWRAREPKSVITEILLLKKDYNIDEVHFLDANINFDTERLNNICKIMIEEKVDVRWVPLGGIYVKTLTEELLINMQKSGCTLIPLGIEHGDTTMQKKIGKLVPLASVKKVTKLTKKLGIWTHGSFILGLPGETIETIKNCIKYAKEADLDSISVFNAIPIPGSKFYDDVVVHTNFQLDSMRFLNYEPIFIELSAKIVNRLRRQFFIVFLLSKFLNLFTLTGFLFYLKMLSKENTRKILFSNFLRLFKLL